MEINIRSETKDDFNTITQINDLAFGGKNEGELIINLRKTKDYITELSLVGLVDDRILGHILFYPITIESINNTFPTVALAPMSVHPDYQRISIGIQLVKNGLQRCKDMHFDSVIVLGHPDYYPRFGFKPASRWNIYSDSEVPDEAFMALELEENSLAGKSGKVVYPKDYLEV